MSILSFLFSNWYVPLGLTIFAFFYYIKGFDLIPDVIPGIGRLDDFLLFGVAIVSWFYYLGFSAIPDLGRWYLNQKTSIQVFIGAGIILMIVWFSSLNTKKYVQKVKYIPVPQRGVLK